MREIGESLHLSRNIAMALLALESWKAFMERWLNSEVLSTDVRDTVVISGKTSKAANEILKVPIAVALLYSTLNFISVIYIISENVEILILMLLFLPFRV